MRSGKLVSPDSVAADLLTFVHGPPPRPRPSRSVVFILDVSGSMEEEVEGGGETRLNAAKTALSQVLRQAPTDGSLEYALTTFGERSGCSVDVPIAFTNDPQRVVSYASGLSPNGGTPFAEALLAGERFGSGVRRRVIPYCWCCCRMGRSHVMGIRCRWRGAIRERGAGAVDFGECDWVWGGSRAAMRISRFRRSPKWGEVITFGRVIRRIWRGR